LLQGNGALVLSLAGFVRLTGSLVRKLVGASVAGVKTAFYRDFLLKAEVDAVVAQYGPQGVAIMDACSELRIPLIVHFHGHDAYRRSILDGVGQHYLELFDQAAAVIAVSRPMESQLLQLGAPREKLHCNPYGVDLSVFGGSDPQNVPPLFLSVGRLVEKKAPHFTLLAFRQVLQEVPEARLVVIGDGHLLEFCEQVVALFGLSGKVKFAGHCSHEHVAEAMRQARTYVQHSLQAADGDSEGTPVSILEASASGLPVISTRHAGIPDVIVDGETGYLVDEGDIEGMAERMVELARSPRLAARLGQAGQARIQAHYSLDQSISNLWKILVSAIAKET
jgi:glycosyltransferase involved in cell wall biosynthesis